jgi:hypothetical protein
MSTMAWSASSAVLGSSIDWHRKDWMKGLRDRVVGDRVGPLLIGPIAIRSSLSRQAAISLRNSRPASWTSGYGDA